MPRKSVAATGHKTTAENTAKVARRRAHEAAERDLGGTIPKGQENYRLPHKSVDDLIDDDVKLRRVCSFVGGIEDFKILRGAVVQAALTTSVEFRHELVEAATISRAGSVLVVDVYEIDRDALFGDADEEE